MKSLIAPYVPYRVKRFLKTLYANEPISLENSIKPKSYDERMTEEKKHYLEMYKDRAEDEPLFERAPASWGYLERATERLIRSKIGYSQWEYIVHQANQMEAPQMLSLGSGPCGVEMGLAEKITSNYHYHCIDLNEHVLAIGQRQMEKRGLNMTVQAMDLNFIELETEKYDIITAFAALHHLDELEKIYAAINNALKPNGIFATVDVITRNGLMMWPETYEVVKGLWSIWPDKYKFNHTSYATPRFTPEHKNVDYGKESFEAIRSQDLLPLLPEFFDPIIYIPYYSISRRFLDTQYGPNYDLNDPYDYGMVEFIWNLDCYYIRERVLPPETMFAVMRKKNMGDSEIVASVSQRMQADSRARQKSWIKPPQLQTLGYWFNPASNELLANPQFEILENGLPLAWITYGHPVIDASGIHSSSGKVMVQADKNNGLYQPVPVTPNKRYLLRHLTRADQEGQHVRLQINWHDKNNEFIKTTIEFVEVTKNWRENEMAVVAPPNAVQALVYVSVHENSRVWYDHLSFVEIKENPVPMHGSLVKS